MNSESENKNRHILPSKTKVESIINTEAKSQSFIRHTPIISYTGKKKRKRFSFRRLIIPFLAFLFASLVLSVYAEIQLRPKIRELSMISAKKMIAETVNETVGSLAKDGLLSYDAMVTCNRDAAGNVNFLEVNTNELSQSRALIVKTIDSALKQRKKVTVSVPFGTLSGWNLFSGVGLPVRVKVHPIGATEGEIYTVLEDCGINQTRHLIRVDVKVVLMCVLPEENCTVEAEISVPLGERVLVGEVPEIYLDSIGTG